MVAEVKNRRVNKADIERVEKFVSGELDTRKTSTFRKEAEAIWKEVDRQIAMKPMTRTDPSGKTLPKSWHNVFELGELSKASEIITADVMRICFPKDEFFECHVEVETPEGEIEEDNQRKVDGVLLSLMTQQHLDFGLKPRVELSVKEALHHGGYAALVRWHKEMLVKDGDKVKIVGSPIWQPFSMWNTYPDPSPSVIPSGLFYTGSMILVEYMPLWKMKKQKGEGWMPNQYHRIKEDEKETAEGVSTKDAELVHYIGDLFIERKNEDGGIYLPNSHVITANGILVFYASGELPYSNVIYDGYERQDIRNPYYTSCIIKQSPIQKITTICANKFLDGIALKTEPPGEYDGSDPDYVANGGPVIAPGAQTPTRSIGKGWKTLDIGNSPEAALEGMQMGLRQMQEGTGVSALRSGTPNSDRQTATEIQKVAQGSEVRTVDFVAKLENRGLRPFLYMQHELNRLHLEDYSFYNNEMRTPDFMRLSKDDIDHDSHFDIVGSRGLLGEEQRTQRISQATLMFSGNPLFAPKLRATEIMLDIYRDAGKKNPEEFVNVEDGEDPQVAMLKQQMAEQMQEVQKQIQQKEKELESIEEQLKKQEGVIQKKGTDLALQKLELKKQEELFALKKQLDGFTEQEKGKRSQQEQANQAKEQEMGQNADAIKEMMAQLQQSQKEVVDAMKGQIDAIKTLADSVSEGNKQNAELAKQMTKPRKVEVKRTASGITGTLN